MSEKRFVVENDNNEVSIKDKVKDNYPFALAYEHIDDADNLIQECLSLVVLLNEQQSTINALKDIFKDIITYSEWDSKKPYCSLRIAVDKKTYYKIREILNE